MRCFSIGSLLVAAALMMGLATGSHAQASRTWVSGVGDDANACSRTAPCKTFAGAISKTAAEGEISVLDPAGYLPVTITKSITISGDGTLASILNASTNGIIIDATSTGVVHLRNLSIAGFGTGLSGVRILSAGQVSLENVTISGQTVAGVNIVPTASVASPADQLNVVLHNVSIRDVTGGASPVGVAARAAAGWVVNVVADGLNVQRTTTGVLAEANATIDLTNSNINFTTTGVSAPAATSVVRVSNSTISMNTTGLSTAAGGQIISYNNNRLRGNTTDGAPTSTVYLR